MNKEEWSRLSQLFDDVLPYYSRIAVTVPDKEFIHLHHDACVRMALAGKQAVLEQPDIKPEDAIFSDPQFAQCIEYAWKNIFAAAGYNVTCVLQGLGEVPEIQQIYVEHAQAAVAQAEAE